MVILKISRPTGDSADDDLSIESDMSIKIDSINFKYQTRTLVHLVLVIVGRVY